MSKYRMRFKAVSTSWLSSKKRRTISDAAECVWLALLLDSCAYGALEADPEEVFCDCFAMRKGWTAQKVQKALEELNGVGLIKMWTDHLEML